MSNADTESELAGCCVRATISDVGRVNPAEISRGTPRVAAAMLRGRLPEGITLPTRPTVLLGLALPLASAGTDAISDAQ